MKLLISILTTLTLPLVAFAHCPVEIKFEGNSYCTDIKWDFSEQKNQNGYVETTEISPVLIPMGTIPPLWKYSKAQMMIWKNGDAQHTPQDIPGFRVFPYMHMDNGHHHSTAYRFQFDGTTGLYVIEKMAFVEMPGCWSLRWTTETKDSLETSEQLTTVFTCDENSQTLPHDGAHGHH